MKKQMKLMLLAMAILMLAEYQARGYFAIGAEILIAPLWYFAIREYFKWKRGEAK